MPKLTFEQRTEYSTWVSIQVALIALGMTAVGGSVLFAIYGVSPLRGLAAVFYEPLQTSYGIGEVC